jgi:hypothetical protein
MVAKLSRAVIILAIAVAVLWIEHGRRIDIDASASGLFVTPAAAAACPDSESVPYPADCIAFMLGSAAPSDGRAQAKAAETPGQDDPRSAACPSNNENVPYSAACIRFMSGWFWRVN